MELSNLEVAVLEGTVADAQEGKLDELSDLQLALIGGGMGETINA